MNAFVPVIFELHEDVENRVTLGLTETEDVISFMQMAATYYPEK